MKPFRCHDYEYHGNAGGPMPAPIRVDGLWKGLLAAERAMESGRKKYGNSVVQKTPTEHANALLRHLLRYLDDPGGVDKDSGLAHTDHIAARALLLVHEIERDNGIGDAE